MYRLCITLCTGIRLLNKRITSVIHKYITALIYIYIRKTFKFFLHYRVLFYVLRTWLNDSAGEAK